MSHNLSQNASGQHEMFVAGAPAWHNLGRNVSQCLTWDEAIKAASLDWTISKKQLANPLTGQPIPSYAIIRDDDNRWLSTVGERYTPIQNSQAFDFTDALLSSGEAHFASAGALGNGEVIWCLAKLNATFSPVPNDLHETYLLFTDRRDGGAAQVRLTTVRVVCNNTLNFALGQKVGKNVLRLRHTAGITAKIDEAKALLSTVTDEIGRVDDLLGKLVRVKLTKATFSAITEKLFPGSTENKSTRSVNKAAAVAANLGNNDGGKIAGIGGTAYVMLQAVTQWVDHQRDGLKTGGGDLAMARAESAMFGTGDHFKGEALKAICDIVGVDIDGSLVTDGEVLA